MKYFLTLLLSLSFFLLYSQTQLGSDIDGEAIGDEFGRSVAMSSDGTRIAVGAADNDGTAPGQNFGHVRILEESGGIWTQVGNDIDGEAASDQSGYYVALSADGTRVIIGAIQNDGNGSNAGHARIFEESGGTWTQVGSDIDGGAVNDFLGYSVSISSDGTRVAIGAPRASTTGQVMVFEESGGTWTQVGSDIDGEGLGDFFGISVSLSSDGTRVAIGGFFNDGNGTNSGHARIYEESGGTWTQVGSDLDGEAAGDQFGRSVSLSSDGTRVAIGGVNNDGTGTDAGHARIYDESGGTWTQVGSDIDGEAAGDGMGVSIALSADGSRVSVGAYTNDGNGSNAGQVRVFELSGGAWLQVGNDIDGEGANDLFGISTAISSDGSRVIVGGMRNDGIGTDAGHVRVFNNLILPIELLSFEGKYVSNDQVLLTWSTTSEQDNEGFDIQKSNDGRLWESIGFVTGQGTSNLSNHYEYIDSKSLSDVNYYRLKQVDHDESFAYSKVIVIENNYSKGKIQVFPNPSNGLINIEIKNTPNQKAILSLFDNMGRKVWKNVLNENESNWKTELSLEAKGIYLLAIQIGSEIFFERIVVMKKQ